MKYLQKCIETNLKQDQLNKLTAENGRLKDELKLKVAAAELDSQQRNSKLEREISELKEEAEEKEKDIQSLGKYANECKQKYK